MGPSSYRPADPHCVPAQPSVPPTPGSQSQLPPAAALVAFSAHLCEKYPGGPSGGRQGGVPRYILQRPERPHVVDKALLLAEETPSQPASQRHDSQTWTGRGSCSCSSCSCLVPLPLPLPLPVPLEPGTCNHFRFHFPGAHLHPHTTPQSGVPTPSILILSPAYSYSLPASRSIRTAATTLDSRLSIALLSLWPANTIRILAIDSRPPTTSLPIDKTVPDLQTSNPPPPGRTWAF